MTAREAGLTDALSLALTPGFGLTFSDLYDRDGLHRLDRVFLTYLGERDPTLAVHLDEARRDPPALPAKTESELLISLAPHLDAFLAVLFGIESEVAALRTSHLDRAPLYSVKRLFVQRRAVHKADRAALESFDAQAAREHLESWFGEPFSELTYARHVTRWLADEPGYTAELEVAQRYAGWAVLTPGGRALHRDGVLFKIPAKIDHTMLVPVSTQQVNGHIEHNLPPSHWRTRDGFALTDRGTDLTGALDQTHYCIWCHEQGKDSCAKGLREKGTTVTGFKKTAFGIPLAGCPLEERISEFQLLKSRGDALAALAMICVANPMAAATGHRICNDCMKACIYQKQTPVDIPQAETRTLKDVLALPWGFEIYSLLTRWNPLDLRRPLPRVPTGRKILIVGLGPAGFTLAHHLVNDGHTVVAIDGLKIEPLPQAWVGSASDGAARSFEPIRDLSMLHEPLDERVMAGFGGVAEYGITVRWDKNFLKIVRLLLERRNAFQMFGGVRFGGTITLDDAWALGFDHVALCIGAGRPTVLDIPNGLARGVRAASDFLMALQLTGAAKAEALANMQLRMPVVVVGGGLTAIDAATEALAYYVVQVEKFLARYEALGSDASDHPARRRWTADEATIADELLDHARAIRNERSAAAAEQRPPRLQALLRSWGGATIAYRRRLIDSPSYTLNHEEVEKALEEGVIFAEGLTPAAIETDDTGAACALCFTGASGVSRLPARTVLVAAGTQPNTVLAREAPAQFVLDGRYFAACDENGHAVSPERASAKPDTPRVLLARIADGRFVSYFGDVHPSYFGNVVKAMASAKQGYPSVSRVLARREPQCAISDADFFRTLRGQLIVTVERVERLTPTIVEIVLRAPLAARKFQPGQFYRLQNFETLSPRIRGTRMQMEGLALTGAWVDRERGIIATIVLEMGGSSSLCAMLQPGEPVILMGPTGTPTEIVAGTTAILCGGGLGNAVLFSIGQALRAAGSRVVYFAGYKKLADRYKVEEIERAADVVVWCCDEAPGYTPQRAQDKAYVGNIVAAMHAYATGALGDTPIALAAASRLIAIGSDRMMAAVASARHGLLEPHLAADHAAIGSINSPMQCMMKEICAQCLQTHTDPKTGKTTCVFSCANQDQPLDRVDFAALDQRLRQNAVSEKLTALWMQHLMPELRTQRSLV